MRLHLEASPDELEVKSGKLVEALSDLFRAVAPELSESLEKALPAKEQELKYPVLRALQKKTQELYEKQLKAMVKDIEAVLDRSVKKAEGFYDPTQAIAQKDDIAYRRVRQVLVGMGWLESDFDEGGPLYGWSVNELLDLAKQKRAG